MNRHRRLRSHPEAGAIDRVPRGDLRRQQRHVLGGTKPTRSRRDVILLLQPALGGDVAKAPRLKGSVGMGGASHTSSQGNARILPGLNSHRNSSGFIDLCGTTGRHSGQQGLSSWILRSRGLLKTGIVSLRPQKGSGTAGSRDKVWASDCLAVCMRGNSTARRHGSSQSSRARAPSPRLCPAGSGHRAATPWRFALSAIFCPSSGRLYCQWVCGTCVRRATR